MSSPSIQDLRLWVGRHLGQEATAHTRDPHGNQPILQGILAVDINGVFVVQDINTQTVIMFPKDDGTEYMAVSCLATATAKASTFCTGSTVVSPSSSRPNSPAAPSASPAPTPPHSTRQVLSQAAVGASAPATDVSTLINLVASLARSVSQQQQQITALTTSVSQAVSMPRAASSSPTHGSPGHSDTAAVLNHLRELEEEKSKIFCSKKIGRDHSHLFTSEEALALQQLPVAFEFHKEEEYFMEHVLAVVALAAFIVKHLVPCFKASSPVGEEVTSFFTDHLKREKLSLGIERTGYLRSACAALDRAIHLRDTLIAQEAFLCIALLSLLLDKEHEQCYRRLFLCTISATPTSATTASQALAGKTSVRVSKVLGSLPAKKGAGPAGF